MVYRVEIHWLSGKEKVLGTAVNKKGDSDSHLWYFQEKGANVNSASCCQLLRQNPSVYWMTLVYLSYYEKVFIFLEKKLNIIVWIDFNLHCSDIGG